MGVQESEALYRRAVAAHPRSAVACYNLAMFLRYQLKHDEAKKVGLEFGVWGLGFRV